MCVRLAPSTTVKNFIHIKKFFLISLLPGSKGVHLEVGGANRQAIEFYLKRGFTLLELELEPEPHQDDVIVLGQEL